MHEAERVFRRLIEEGFNAGDLSVADELTAPDMVEHQDYGPGHAPGAEGVRAVMASLRRAFSDFRLDIQDVTVKGDAVWARLVGSGTNDGPYMGHPPTGRRMEVDVFDVVRVVDGRIVEHWGVPDRLSALLQMGIVQPPVRQATPVG
jgi:predicted ester cyclase